jgi:Ti-type conjugative transfer relaxase TraA
VQRLGRALLNIGRMAPGRADYYLTAVARGDDRLEGYYLARGEEPGRWLGHGAETLGLSGEVTAEQLRAVLAGRDPTTGGQLTSHPARKVPGFDHTFRAPKSVSLLWALGDRDTAEQVVAAHDAAVDAAIGYLQRAAGFSRRGAAGVETVAVDGFVAAAFRHRTSRADDPLLHTHVLVANLARTTDDGIWRTLDSRKLFAHAKTAGVLYQAHLRHELTTRLGVAWQPVVNGHADIDGVDRQLIETFSRRRTAIVAHMTDRGETSAAAAQTATLATREAKGERLSEAELRATWTRRAAAAGVRPGWHDRLVGKVSWERPDLGPLWKRLVVEEGLTEASSSFTRRDVLQQLAGLLPDGAPVGYVEQVADAILNHDTDLLVALGPTRGHLTHVDVIRRADGRVVPVDVNERRYTTRGLLLTEQRAINRSLDRHREGHLAIAEPSRLEHAIGRRTLTDEQAAMVRRLTSSGAGVEVVVGKAGTGKTYALDAARGAWEASGIRVTGVALAARAALELEASAGIRSMTLARLLGQLDDDRHGSPLQPGSVLVVDEAGMIGTRQLARLLHHAEQQSVKVVLVGDPRQLPEIDAGGLFRALTTRLPAIELTDNRRQAHSWEQSALDELRHGNPDTALATYRKHGRIRTADTAEQLRATLVDDWWDTARQDLAGSLMIALRRDDVDELNHRARAKMLAAGQLTGPTLVTPDGVELQAGDRIVCLRNDRRLGVVNGTRATITGIDVTRRSLEAVDDRGVQLLLPAGYLDARHVTHGYAITGHKAQGLTCDHTYTLGTETLYREWGYVAMSRGRITNQLYHGPGPDRDDDGLHHDVHLDDQTSDLTSRLRRSRAEQPLTPELVEIAAAWREIDAHLDRIDVPRLREGHRDLERLESWRDRLVEDVAQRRKRLAAEASGRGAVARFRRRRAIEELEVELEQSTTGLADVTQRLSATKASLAGLPDRRELYRLIERRLELDEQLERAASSRVRGFGFEPPTYITNAIGSPPPDRGSAARWERTAVGIEHHRLKWQISDPVKALGSGPPDRQAQFSRSALRAEIEQTVRGVQRHRESQRRRGLAR